MDIQRAVSRWASGSSNSGEMRRDGRQTFEVALVYRLRLLRQARREAAGSSRASASIFSRNTCGNSGRPSS